MADNTNSTGKSPIFMTPKEMVSGRIRNNEDILSEQALMRRAREDQSVYATENTPIFTAEQWFAWKTDIDGDTSYLTYDPNPHFSDVLFWGDELTSKLQVWNTWEEARSWRDQYRRDHPDYDELQQGGIRLQQINPAMLLKLNAPVYTYVVGLASPAWDQAAVDAATDDAPYDDLGYDGATVWEQRLQSLFGRDFEIEWIDAWTVRLRTRQLLVVLEKVSTPT